MIINESGSSITRSLGSKHIQTMQTPLEIVNTIRVNAPASRLWTVLTSPDQTRKYMFGCETVSDWKPGSPLLWKGSHEGREMVFVKGIITRIEPGRFLSYTVIDPHSGMEDVPENYLTVTYQLLQDNDQTLLTVTQGDYNQVAEGEKRYREAYNEGQG